MADQILWTALVTPFDETGESIDYKSLTNLLILQSEAKNGVVIAGSTGEGLSLRDDERKELIKFIANLKLNLPIIVGVPSVNLDQAIRWIDFCNNLEIFGYLMTTPIYTKPGVMGQTLWFEKLLTHASKPVVLYNIPSRAGVSLHPQTIQNLQNRIWAIKDSSGTIESVREYKKADPNIKILCGDDYMMVKMAREGGEGLVSVISNVWLKATRKYVTLSLQNRLVDEKIWYENSLALFTASNPIPIKMLLYDLGLIQSPQVRLPLSILDLPAIDPLRKAHGEITEWDENNH